jgi:endoglucanase
MASVAAIVVVNVLSPPPQPPAPVTFPPTTAFYVDPDTAAAQWVRQHPEDRRATDIGSQIASQPQAAWFTNPSPPLLRAEVERFADAAAARNVVPTLVAYAIPNRDCGGASSGGVGDLASYRNWIDHFAQGLGNTTAVVILEPDSLANVGCLRPPEQHDRFAALADAARTVHQHDPQARVYYDAGNSGWQPAPLMAERLQRAGINESGDGLALNVSNFNPTGDEIRYGYAILRKLGNAQLDMVVDTSRNGNGAALGRQFCDPLGRKLGTPPTAATGVQRVDAYLWIKHPGQADGCRAGAGDFVPEEAYHLIRR